MLDDPLSFGFTNTTGYALPSYVHQFVYLPARLIYPLILNLRFCTCAEPTGFFWFSACFPISFSNYYYTR